MTQPELFPPANLGSLPAPKPETVAEAIIAGHAYPQAANPFLWSSTFWEAYALGHYLREIGASPVGFRKSRGSSYVNKAGDTFKFTYSDRAWCITRR